LLSDCARLPRVFGSGGLAARPSALLGSIKANRIA
jgi:hypothetical protein